MSDPAIRRVLWSSLFATVAVFAALWWGTGFVLTQTSLFETGWLETVAGLLGGAAVLVLTWILFPAVASAVVGLFLESVARAVERRHYPALPEAPGESVAQMLATTLRFLAALIVANGVILIFLFVPPVFPFVFYAVNGYLLGREYYELVALRRLDRMESRRLWQARRWRFYLAGTAIAFLLTVPVVNLLTPIVATAAMIHLFETWRPRS